MWISFWLQTQWWSPFQHPFRQSLLKPSSEGGLITWRSSTFIVALHSFVMKVIISCLIPLSVWYFTFFSNEWHEGHLRFRIYFSFFLQCSNWPWTQLQQYRWTFRMLLSECNRRLGVEREVGLSIWGWAWLSTRQVWCIQKFIFINCWKTASWDELNHRSRGLFILQNINSKGLSFIPAAYDFSS